MTRRQSVQPDGVAVPKVPYSSVIVSGDLVFTAGQAPFNAEGTLVLDSFDDQVHQTMRNLGACLQSAGCGFDDVLKVTAYLTDPSYFARYNEIYGQYFSQPYPARTTLVVGLLGFDIEIEAVARKL
ncbi:MAG TPA: RidA family protein [Mycobacteriales bacterium]|jgi:2-iminobutanoate/2-iminopropanoate deaminase|nr:RidA family protein [Mycobacteriales bacterium]